MEAASTGSDQILISLLLSSVPKYLIHCGCQANHAYQMKMNPTINLDAFSFQILVNTGLLYRQMNGSATKGHVNRDIVADNQTMFDFLKRKKKYALESTVNKTLQHHSYTKRKIDLDPDEDFPNATEDYPSRTQYQSNNDANRGTKQHITPKKIDFEDEPRKNKSIVKEGIQPSQKSQNFQGRSFVSMISPLKTGRPASALEEMKEELQNQPISAKKSSKGNDSYSKKSITKSIHSIKQAMHVLTDTIRTLKEKSRSLLIQFNPLFTFVSQTNAPIANQVGDFRNKLKAFESIISSVDTDNTDQSLESFHKTLEEHIQFEEGHLRKTLERAKDEEMNSLKIEKDRQMERLQAENRKLSKQIDLLSRRLSKAESSQGDIVEAAAQRQVHSLEQAQRIKQNYQLTIHQLNTKNQQLISQCELLSQQNKGLQRQCKDQKYNKQEDEERNREELQKIIEAKDAYLLNQIMIMRSEFDAELKRVNQLHRAKEQEILARLTAKEQIISKNAFQRECDKQIQGKIIEEVSLLRQENLQLKSKTECIINDMYRMNEQLYQHWMALKDVKALATRLGSYSQFRKIFEDVLFNDHLFR